MDDVFLKPEYRCEFYVDEARKKLWKCELDILKKFDALCNEYGLDYFLIGGALLGAVRHQGFIPWDDDVDIGMLRDDYEVFLEHAPAWFDAPYFVQNGYNDSGYFGTIARIRDSRTTGVIWRDAKKDCNNGIFVEIYPIDTVTDNPNKLRLQHIEHKILFKLLYQYQYGDKNNLMGRLSKAIVGHVGFETLYKKWSTVCARYRKEKATFCDSLTAYWDIGGQRWYLEDVKDTIYVPFEYIRLRIPRNYDRCLKITYGEYMQLPPVEERGQHHNRTVYYNPDIPYTEAIRSGIVDSYFDRVGVKR